METMIQNKIDDLNMTNKYVKVVRIIRSYISYYNVRQKELSGCLGVSQGTLSKILNEDWNRVSPNILKSVIHKLMEKLDIGKFVHDILDFESVDSEIKSRIEHLEGELDKVRVIKERWYSN